MKTSELTGAALDWAVAKCEGVDVFIDTELFGCPRLIDKRIEEWVICPGDCVFDPSTDWAQGGPIIEREHINTCSGYQWEASKDFDAIGGDSDTAVEYGPTTLIAAMRCYVASNLGDEIEIPEELK